MRSAFFSVLVQTSDHYKRGDLVLSALLLKCSAQCLRSELPWYLIYADGGQKDSEDLKLLEEFGWTILNHTVHYNLVRSIYKPVYAENDTSTMRDMRILRSNARRQPRVDGWATYFKFYAWRAAGYDRVVLMDVDSFFTENPDPAIRAVPQDVVFMATTQNHNWMRGINSHMMIIRPSNQTFNELVYRAREGEYVPFTNGEQDVLEAIFPPRLEHKNKLDMRRLFPHVHYRLVPLYRNGKAWPPRSCDDVFRICNMSKHPEYGLQWQQMEERCSLRGRSS